MKLTEKVRDRLSGLFFIFGFVCFTVTRQYCTLHMPEAPQVEIGRTMPLEANYGKTVYLTSSELRHVHLVYAVAAASGFIAVGIMFFYSWQIFKEARDGKT